MQLRPRTNFKSRTSAGIVGIPNQLKPVQRMVYPADNHVTFERFYLDSFTSADQRERLYLPIQWTALYCNNNFGKCNKTHGLIQTILNKLDKTKKYYTIVQYDDGILNHINHLDIKVFAMSGPRVDYPLPLLCQPHGFKFPNVDRDIFASFVGRITHPIRQQMVDVLKDLPGYYISTKPHSIKDYCEILTRSKYALCPRGYGQTSFRICEAIEYGAIPVYVSDHYILPYNLSFYFGILSETTVDLPMTFDALDCDHNYRVFQSEINKVKSLYTFTGCKQMILKELEND